MFDSNYAASSDDDDTQILYSGKGLRPFLRQIRGQLAAFRAVYPYCEGREDDHDVNDIHPIDHDPPLDPMLWNGWNYKSDIILEERKEFEKQNGELFVFLDGRLHPYFKILLDKHGSKYTALSYEGNGIGLYYLIVKMSKTLTGEQELRLALSTLRYEKGCIRLFLQCFDDLLEDLKDQKAEYSNVQKVRALKAALHGTRYSLMYFAVEAYTKDEDDKKYPTYKKIFECLIRISDYEDNYKLGESLVTRGNSNSTNDVVNVIGDVNKSSNKKAHKSTHPRRKKNRSINNLTPTGNANTNEDRKRKHSKVAKLEHEHTCYRCAEFGHFGSQCTIYRRSEDAYCNTCKKTGHCTEMHDLWKIADEKHQTLLNSKKSRKQPSNRPVVPRGKHKNKMAT